MTSPTHIGSLDGLFSLKSLAQEIADLGPVPSTSHDASRPWPELSPLVDVPERPSAPPPRPSRSLKREPLPPIIVKEEGHGTIRGRNQKHKAVEPPQREDFRARLVREAPTTPEVHRKHRKSTSNATTTNSDEAVPFPSARPLSTQELMDELQDQIAQDREDRAKEYKRGRSSPKLTIKIKPPQVVLAERFTAEIRPDSKITTIWDGKYDETFAWPGTIVVRDARPPSHFYARHAMHDFAIQFQGIAEVRATILPSELGPDYPFYTPWHTEYTGQRINRCRDASKPPEIDPKRGIAIEHGYEFVEPDAPNGPFTWLVRFWVPVPVQLFAHAEHKMFVCRASVMMEDYGCEGPQPSDVVAEPVVVGIERLRSDRLLAVR
ncbi:hypothetical protein BD413DRAFT_613419 [Trametes elegans]|nr:hypothetical protein BD413DRAFT_613419 [Trametes elegans]